MDIDCYEGTFSQEILAEYLLHASVLASHATHMAVPLCIEWEALVFLSVLSILSISYIMRLPPLDFMDEQNANSAAVSKIQITLALSKKDGN